MKLNIQKKLAAKVAKTSKKNIKLDQSRLEDMKESVTKTDIKNFIKEGAIRVIPKRGTSRVRARKISKQKAKGLRKGVGSRKGKSTARAPKKETWMNKIRAQRDLLNIMKEGKVISPQSYRMLYRKAKGGFFRSRRHIKLYIDDNNLSLKK